VDSEGGTLVGVAALVDPPPVRGDSRATMSELKEQIIAAERELDAYEQGGWALRDG